MKTKWIDGKAVLNQTGLTAFELCSMVAAGELPAYQNTVGTRVYLSVESPTKVHWGNVPERREDSNGNFFETGEALRPSGGPDTAESVVVYLLVFDSKDIEALCHDLKAQKTGKKASRETKATKAECVAREYFKDVGDDPVKREVFVKWMKKNHDIGRDLARKMFTKHCPNKYGPDRTSDGY